MNWKLDNVALNQAYLFLIFILNGIIIGIIFDIFRILRQSFNTPNFVTYIEDVLFWIISLLTVLYTLFEFNNGEIRLYICIAILTGIIFYMIFFSKIIVKTSVSIMKILKKVFGYIFKIISYPVKIIWHIIEKCLNFVKNKKICLNFRKK